MNRAALIFAATFVVIAAVYYSVVGFGELSPSSDQAYVSEDLGIAFQYPDGYVVDERDVGNGERARRDIVLTAKADLPPPQNGEGPPTITIEAFQNNIDNYTADALIRSTNFTNFKLSQDGVVTEESVAGEKALGFGWSGLYEGRSVVVAQPDWVFVFSVTYLTPEDAIIADFENILKSVRFSAAN